MNRIKRSIWFIAATVLGNVFAHQSIVADTTRPRDPRLRPLHENRRRARDTQRRLFRQERARQAAEEREQLYSELLYPEGLYEISASDSEGLGRLGAELRYLLLHNQQILQQNDSSDIIPALGSEEQ